MKRGGKSKPAKNSKGAKSQVSQVKLQTISSMFERANTRHSSLLKSDDGDKQNSCDTEEGDDDDVVLIEVEETKSSYFNNKQPEDSPKISSKRTTTTSVSGESNPRKKSRLSLSRSESEGTQFDSNKNGLSVLGERVGEETCSSQLKPACSREAKNFTSLSQAKSENRVRLCEQHRGSQESVSVNNGDGSVDDTKTNVPALENKADLGKTDSRMEDNDKQDVKRAQSSPATSSDSLMSSDKKSSNVALKERNIVDKNSEIENAADEEIHQFTEPYYFNNFETILSSVLQDDSNSHLFNDEDRIIFDKYNLLSDCAKKIYIRMFGRRLQWIPLMKMNYPEIAENLRPHLDELVEASFAHNETDLTDLHTVLEALSAPDVKTLAKVYHVPSNITQKGQQVTELLKQTQRTNISDMFKSGGGKGGLSQAMIVRAKKFLDGVYKLCELPRAVFVRVMMLFSVVNTTLDEDSGIGGQGQLFHMLMVNMGKVVYPSFEIVKKHKIFGSRADVLRFSEALQLEFDFLHATEKGKWDEAYTVYLAVVEKRRALEADQDIVSWNKNLPDFLRSFTATSVVYRLLSASVEILQRRKDYAGAVNLLQSLLDQDRYCVTYRGYWWERLALNFDAHLKKPEQSLESVLSGLADSHVRVGHRLALYQRGKSICERPRLKLSHCLEECRHPPLRDLPKVHLEGRVLHSSVGAGPRFLTQASYRREEDGDGMGDLAVCGVEEFVLDHYRTHGFPSGMHAEGSVVSSLFALFCWDILFLPKPDAFHSPYQSMPLDLYTDGFYERRKEEIDQRMDNLASSSVEELQTIAEDNWTTYSGVACVGMNWERMRSAECIKELVACMGPKVLTGILTRYAHSPRHTRSGFPDLTLWNPATGALKICEVKGPGDRLSHKQILWLDYLLSLRVDAEVCHVKAVAAKRLMPSS